MKYFVVILLLLQASPLFARIDTIVILTYNIHHAEGLDGKIDTERIAKLMLEQNASLVALQEVDRGVDRTNGRDLVVELAKLTNMFYLFGKNINYQNGDYGNAILSKFPIETGMNHHYKMLREGEQRGLLIAEIKELNLVFMNTHIDYRKDDAERVSNVEEILNIKKNYNDKPIIICGDFNDDPESRTHTNMKKEFVDVWEEKGEGNGFSYPAENPEKRIDYIFFSKEKNKNIKFISAQTIASSASDHLPLKVVMVLEK